MKKIICIVLICVLLSNTKSFSQTVNLPADSAATLLCKKWEVDYALMGDMKISEIPGVTTINYEFNKDKTFLITSDNPKDRTKGTWAYDAKKKLIKLTINGKSNTSIISLKDGELVMLAAPIEATPADPTELKIVYKTRTK